MVMKIMRNLPFVLFLTLIYLLLTSNLEWLNIIAGVVIATGINLLLRPQIKPVSWQRAPRAILAMIQYLGILIYDIFKGGIMVARSVWSRKLKIQPSIIAIPSGCESELATALSAHATSIAPGELVVEIDTDGVMYTHVLDVTHSTEYQEQAQNMRRELLSKIIE
jgi:multicomponent Na+:H+ antiporter subunit E